MPNLKWDEKFSVKVTELDRQHKRFLDLINQLYESLQHNNNEDTLTAVMKELDTQSSAVEELMRYAVYHFETEEKYMVKYQYPEYEHHKREHEIFTRKIKSLKKNFDDGKAIHSTKIIKFLINWYREHILGVDKKYGSYFNERGLN